MPVVFDWTAVLEAVPNGGSNLITIHGPRADKKFLEYYLPRSAELGADNFMLPKIVPIPNFKNGFQVTLDRRFIAIMLTNSISDWKDGRLKITGEDGIFFTAQPVVSFGQSSPRREAGGRGRGRGRDGGRGRGGRGRDGGQAAAAAPAALNYTRDVIDVD